MIKKESTVTVPKLPEDETIVLENREIVHLTSTTEKETRIIKKVTCKRCGRSWEPRVSNPKQCPYCKRYDWNEDK